MTGLAEVHDAQVAAAFDRQVDRFRPTVAADDVRLAAVLDGLGSVRGRRVLDLGCGRGRFAGWLAQLGAEVIGLDRSPAMLSRGGVSLPRVLATSRRLPFADASFDAVVAIEVFEHLGPAGRDATLSEARRILRPGGRLVVVDKNAGSLDPVRPWLPALVVKWIDQRRGRWMYPAGGAVRERWFWPRRFRARIARHFGRVELRYLITASERERAVFRSVPCARRFVAWTAQVPEATR